MLSAIAYRSLAQAKADHADIKVFAAGDSGLQQEAIQMLKDAAPTTGVGYAPTPPRGPDETLRAAHLSSADEQYEPLRAISSLQLRQRSQLFDEPAISAI